MNAPPDDDDDDGKENRQNATATSKKDSQLALLRKRHAINIKNGHSGGIGATNSPTTSDSATEKSAATQTQTGEDSLQVTMVVPSSPHGTSRNQDEKDRVAHPAVEETKPRVEPPQVCRGGDEHYVVGQNGGEGAIAIITGDVGVEDNARNLSAPPSTSHVMMPTLATSPSQSDWKRAVTESGRAYEYHKESRTTRWVLDETPRTYTSPQTDVKVHQQRHARRHVDGTLATPLNQPLGNWRQAFTSEGNVYYYNRETRVSTWMCPDATLDIDRGGDAAHLRKPATAAGQSGDEPQTVRQLFANSPSVGAKATTAAATPAQVDIETTCFCPFCGDRCGSTQLGQHLLQACTSQQHLERDQPMAFLTVRSQLLQAVVQWEAVDAARRQEQQHQQLESSRHALTGYNDDDDDVQHSTDTVETTDFSRPELKETCELCGREFAKGRLACHAKVCERVFMHKRPAFNAQQKRLDGTPQKRMLYGVGTVFCALCGNGFDNEGLKRHMKVTMRRLTAQKTYFFQPCAALFFVRVTLKHQTVPMTDPPPSSSPPSPTTTTKCFCCQGRSPKNVS
jgi:hypothetical protein